MIRVDDFDRRPIVAGESRRVILSGDGPFSVTVSCFVNNPPPPGFRPCPECSTKKIQSGQEFFVTASRQLWRERTGQINIDITDTKGEQLKLSLGVIVDTEASPMAFSAGA